MVYCFDTSALIGGWARNYPPDVFPGLWEYLDELIEEGRLIWNEEVIRELSTQEDGLHKWAKERVAACRELSDQVQGKTSEILLKHPRMLNTKRSRPTADPFIVAQAAVSGAIMVTEEGPSGTSKRLHIPDVCRAIDVECISLLRFLQREKIRFVTS